MQSKLQFYGKGISKTKSGHLRYSSPSSLRGKYVHRHVVESNIEQTPYSVRVMLPWPYEVHHMDFDKTNNWGENLLMLSAQFHSALTCNQRRIDGKFNGYSPKWKPAPEWVLFDDQSDEVPF